jgi:AhpD family alkylhydroperoxidase
MTTFTIPTKETAAPASAALFANLENGLGFLPNLYAYIGHSPNALANYLAFQQGQTKGAFKAREREAINLVVSQVNGCRYCQSAHTALGKLNGFSDEEILGLRAGQSGEARLQAIVTLAADITRTQGHPSPASLVAFFAQGYDQAALVDLVSLIADKILSNFLHNITRIAIDFPVAPELEAVEA